MTGLFYSAQKGTETLPNALRTARQAVGLTQTQLAARAGVTIGTISHVEHWGFVPRAETQARLAAALGRSVSDLFPPTAAREMVAA